MLSNAYNFAWLITKTGKLCKVDKFLLLHTWLDIVATNSISITFWCTEMLNDIIILWYYTDFILNILPFNFRLLAAGDSQLSIRIYIYIYIYIYKNIYIYIYIYISIYIYWNRRTVEHCSTCFCGLTATRRDAIFKFVSLWYFDKYFWNIYWSMTRDLNFCGAARLEYEWGSRIIPI